MKKERNYIAVELFAGYMRIDRFSATEKVWETLVLGRSEVP